MKDVLSLKHAILATLNYFDLFDFPLTAQEIEEYLYGWSAPADTIETEMKSLPQISNKDGFYFLTGREGIVEQRQKKHLIGHRLWQRVKKFSWLFAICPFVKMVAVCNSLAYGNVKETSDIDLFIVVENKKLALARFFMKVLTQIFALRAHHKKIAERFCLSFFVTEKAMNLSNLAYDFDPHLAYFAKTITPLFSIKTYNEWLQENNSWTAFYFKKTLSPRLFKIKKHYFASFFRFLMEIILRLFGKLPEIICNKLLFKREFEHKKKFPYSKGIVINKMVFKFHEEDPRETVAEQFQERLENL